MKPIFLILLMIGYLHADSKYEKALHYLNGEMGAKIIIKEKPRCPYERCKGTKRYKHITKDKKMAYKLLKEASLDGDEKASEKALALLLRQINYTNKKYDEDLLIRLKNSYGIDKDTYDKDVIYYLKELFKSKNNIKNCRASYMLYQVKKFGYFGLKKNEKDAEIFKSKALTVCIENSLEYMKLKD